MAPGSHTPPTSDRDRAPGNPPPPGDGYTRLHITPLDQELLKIVIPPSVLPGTRNISLHTIETFPERRYGFVDFPATEADKLRKKLHGSTLKGVKMRIEPARPEKQTQQQPDDDAAAAAAAAKQARPRKSPDGAETSKKRKRDPNLVEGVLLKDRKVKRGWTESADTKRKSRSERKPKSSGGKDRGSEEEEKKKKKKKTRQRSKYTEHDECLLKTRLPPNAAAADSGDNASGSNKKKKNKSKGGGGGGGGGGGREVTVHEFEKATRFPGFLKTAAPEASGSRAAEFVEGKGWIDEHGNVVEAVKQRAASAPASKQSAGSAEGKSIGAEESSDDGTSSSGASTDDDDTDGAADEEGGHHEKEDGGQNSESGLPDASAASPRHTHAEAGERNKRSQASQADADDSSTSSDDTSSSGGSSDNDHDSDEERNKGGPTDGDGAESRSDAPSSGPSPSPAGEIPPAPTTPSAKVHPLEALYKRPKLNVSVATGSQAGQPFSFFGGPGGETPLAAATALPMTPYTRQDFEYRSVRSAAPTPDTAHPSRAKNFWAPQDEEEAEPADEANEGGDASDAQPEKGQSASSEFQTWFWDNRRELNKSWMTRKKSAAKEKRHRENKARASRAI
ncbi:uncharacterized protein UV8b_07978 [Ustilaginoidea virens]|uniref:Uncharacterized protein n=1 Tax=Ustilaginoidea virens TaxID=1159556 RepID=A0A8E5MLH5_USTVR|nr:uncharacterized protein UV8b_07978 [Ustilaginoidea virens]QUC23737.1 hypothetical protein UV8b_07978 [Ustilaginoidea virens]